MSTAAETFLSAVNSDFAVSRDWEKSWNLAMRLHPETYQRMLEEGAASEARQKSRISTANARLNDCRAVADRARHAFMECVNAHYTRNQDYDRSWEMAKTGRPDLWEALATAEARQLEAANAMTPKVTRSADGQYLMPDGQPNSAWLAKMGLPESATPEQIAIYKTAEKFNPTKEAAAWLIATVTGMNQIGMAMRFDHAMDTARNHFPEIAKLL